MQPAAESAKPRFDESGASEGASMLRIFAKPVQDASGCEPPEMARRTSNDHRRRTQQTAVQQRTELPHQKDHQLGQQRRQPPDGEKIRREPGRRSQKQDAPGTSVVGVKNEDCHSDRRREKEQNVFDERDNGDGGG